MALIDASSNINQLLNNFGLGNNWDLQTSNYTIDADGQREETTISFLDLGNALSDTLGLNVDLSVVPAASEFLDYLKRKDGNSSDTAGRTYLTNNVTKFQNNILEYQRPNSSPVLFNWGNKSSRFTCVFICAGGGHVDKAKLIADTLSVNTGFDGGTFRHAIFGEFNKVFVSDYSMTSGGDLFNGVIFTVNFMCADTYSISFEEPSIANTILGYVESAANIIQIVSSLPNIITQIKASVISPLVNIANAVVGVTDKYIFSTFSTAIGMASEGLASAKESLVQVDPSLAIAMDRLSVSNIDPNYDVKANYDLVLELICGTLGVQVDQYGSGTTTSTVETTFTLSSIVGLTYVEDDVDNFGNRVITTRQVDSFDGSVFTITQNTSTYVTVSGSDRVTYIQSLINDFVIVCGVYSQLYPENYTDYATIIAVLQNSFNQLLLNLNNKRVMDKTTTVFEVTDNLENFLKNNPSLVGCRPLREGMEVYV